MSLEVSSDDDSQIMFIEGAPSEPPPPSAGAVTSIFIGAIVFTGAMVFLVYGLQNKLPIAFVASLPAGGGVLGIALMALGIYLKRRNEADHAKAVPQDLTQLLNVGTPLDSEAPIAKTLGPAVGLLLQNKGSYLVSEKYKAIIVSWKKRDLPQDKKGLHIITVADTSSLSQLDSYFSSKKYTRIDS